MSIFARASSIKLDELPNWRDDEHVRTLHARVDELSERHTRLEAELKEGQRTDGLYETLIVTPSPASPYWPKLQRFQQTCAELKGAQQELAQAEQDAKASAEAAGYDLGFEIWTEHIVPAIKTLIGALQLLEQKRPEIHERTSALIGQLGSVNMGSHSLKEFIAGVERRGVFGNRE